MAIKKNHKRRLKKELDCFAFVRDEVKKFDKDIYLAILRIKPKYRDGLFTIQAFSNELARIPLLVSEPNVGLIRLYWWKERIDEIYQVGKVKNQPVIKCLAEIIDKYHLPKKYFNQIIKYRKHDFNGEIYKSSEELANYVDNAMGNILRLQLLVMQYRSLDEQDSQDIRHLAYALKIIYVIGSLKKRNFNQHPFISEDIIGNLSSKSAMDKLEELLRILYKEAEDNLNELKESEIVQNVRFLSLHKVMIEHYLARLLKAKFKILDSDIEKKGTTSLMLKMLYKK